MAEISLTVNAERYEIEVDANQTLIAVLRDSLKLTGAKIGCDSGHCGTCSVVVNGEVVYACMILAVELDGAEVITVEGLAQDEELHALQIAFQDHSALQCGYCTPGMLMTSWTLLRNMSRPDEDEIRHALVGNLCRCTGYAAIIKAIQVASRARR